MHISTPAMARVAAAAGASNGASLASDGAAVEARQARSSGVSALGPAAAGWQLGRSSCRAGWCGWEGHEGSLNVQAVPDRQPPAAAPHLQRQRLGGGLGGRRVLQRGLGLAGEEREAAAPLRLHVAGGWEAAAVSGGGDGAGGAGGAC